MEEKLELIEEETKDLDITKDSCMKFLKRVANDVKEISDNHLTKEDGGHRLITAIIDFLKENSVEDISEADFDDPDGLVILEEAMDFLIHLHQRLSNKALNEIGQILQRLEEEI